MRLGYGTELARVERERADRDGDGEVATAEGNAFLDERTRELVARLRVCTGPTLEEVTCRRAVAGDVRQAEAQGWKPDAIGHLHFEWDLAFPERVEDIGAVVVEDSHDSTAVEITDVTIHAPREIALTRAGSDRRDGVTTDFTWLESRRPPGPRVIHAAWPAPRRLGLAAKAAVVAGAIALVVMVAWGLRRR